jgi:hypothetical protein
MDPSEVKQMMEHLMARMNENQARRDAEAKREVTAGLEGIMTKIGSLATRMDADKEESMAKVERLLADNREIKADNAEMMATMRRGEEEMIKAITGASQESTEACEVKVKALPEKTEACPEVTHACLEEEKEPAPEESESVAEPEEVPERTTEQETGQVAEDRTGELRLAIKRRRQRKKRAQIDGEPRQKFAAFRGWLTRRAVPATRKGHVRKGPGKRCRRNGVRGPGETSGTRMGGRSLKKRQTRDVVRETPEGRTYRKKRRTRPECNSGIRRLSKTSGNGVRGRIMKRAQRLETKRTHHDTTRQDQRLEIVKIAAESSIGPREPGDWLL